MQTYLNMRPLAAGGGGDLYLAECPYTGMTVVIKYLREFQRS